MIDSRTTTIVRTVHFAVCSGCGSEGADCDTEQDAHDAVMNEGWDTRTSYPGGERVTVYICPACQEVTP